MLFVTSDFVNHHEDMLYDGLCALLGQENVVDFPAKDVFHGRNIDRLVLHYPDLHRLSLDQVASQADSFDAVVVGSIRPATLEVWTHRCNPKRLNGIAARGKALAREKHTSLARARYVLATLGFPSRELVGTRASPPGI